MSHSQFNLKWLSIWWIIAALWFGSWLFAPTRALWDSLDAQVFYWLNGTLETGQFWQGFWAVVNWRPFDIIAAGIIFILSFSWIYQSPIDRRLNQLSGLTLLLIVILATRFSAAFLLYITEYQRYSPSIMLEPSHRLSVLVSWIETKDYHKDCFPGDHGYVVMICIAYFFFQAGKRWGWIALILLSPFMLPRLVGGAHWLTDIAIGSGTMVLVSLPLLLATPLHHYGVRSLNRIHRILAEKILILVKLA